MEEDEECNIFNISSPRSEKITFSIEKITKSKKKKSKAHLKFHEKLYIHDSNDEINKNIKDFDKFLIINEQLKKHNSTPNQKNIMIINDIIDTKTNHYLAVFKDYLIADYIDEFLKRYFSIDECEELIPKFYLYYKNYLNFFCRGIFIDFQANKIIQNNGEFQAELYYNNNYGSKHTRKGKKALEQNISENSGSNSKSESSQNYNNNTNISKINKIKLIFSKSIRKKLGGSESSKNSEKKEISNIYYKNKNETITLNDETKIYNDDNVYTNENSLINLLNTLINKKISKKKMNERKNIKNNINEKNIVNIYKNLLSQSPIKSAKYQNYIKFGISNKSNKKVSSIKIFNKNIPIILKNRNHNLSNEMKTPLIEKTKMSSRNNQSRNSRTNFSSRGNNSINIFIKNSKSKKKNRKTKNNSKSILFRLNLGNFATNRINKSKYTTFNRNMIAKKKKQSVYPSYYFKNMSNNSLNSSRNFKKNIMYSFHSNNICNNNNNNPKSNNKLKNYQNMTTKNKTLSKHRIQNKLYRHKQNWSLSNSNSIYNNFHININNNIMLLNNNNNIKHFMSSRNNIKSHSKSKKKNNNNINNYNYNPKRNNKNITRNENIFDINKYRTEIKNIQANLKNKKNKNTFANKKFMSIEKSKSKNKDKNLKNKEPLVRNKSNLHFNNSNLKVKKFDKSEAMPSLKNCKKINNSNKDLISQNGQKVNVIFDYKKK